MTTTTSTSSALSEKRRAKARRPYVGPVAALRSAAQAIQLVARAPERWAYARGVLSTKGLTLPDFLGIGAQKGGSSWLYQNLACHPQLFLPDQKELHFWDRRYHRSLRSYAAKFRSAGGRVKGEVTPAYSMLPERRVRYMAAVMPRLKVLLLVRNPIERAWSAAVMEVLKRPRRRFEDARPDDFYAHFNSPGSRLRSDYARTLRMWRTAFGADQVWVGFFEDIVARPEELLREVFAYLGVSTGVDWDLLPVRQVVNRGVGVPMPGEYRCYLERLYRDEILSLHDALGPRSASWLAPSS